MYVYTHIRVYIYTYLSLYIYIYTHTHVHSYVCIYIYIEREREPFTVPCSRRSAPWFTKLNILSTASRRCRSTRLSWKIGENLRLP